MKERQKKHKEEFLSLLKDCVWVKAGKTSTWNESLVRSMKIQRSSRRIGCAPYLPRDWISTAPVKSFLKVSFVRTRSDLFKPTSIVKARMGCIHGCIHRAKSARHIPIKADYRPTQADDGIRRFGESLSPDKNSGASR